MKRGVQFYLETLVGMVLEDRHENRKQVIVNREDWTK